jgi:hypothetical protein
MYVPKGPALDATKSDVLAAVLDHLQGLARRRGAIWLKIDPDVIAGTGVPGEPDAADNPAGQAVVAALKARGWRFSASQVQFRNTVTLDLTQPADDLLMAMHQSTRRKVRTAEKKDVAIRRPAWRTSPPCTTCTSRRIARRLPDPPAGYYQDAWGTFMRAGLAQAFLAEYDGIPLAHVILLHFGPKCWYFYGASSTEERQRMPITRCNGRRSSGRRPGLSRLRLLGCAGCLRRGRPDVGRLPVQAGLRRPGRAPHWRVGLRPLPPLYWAYEMLMPRLLARLRRRNPGHSDVTP